MTAIFLSFVNQKSLLKSRLASSQKAQNWITIYVGMRPTSATRGKNFTDSVLGLLLPRRQAERQGFVAE